MTVKTTVSFADRHHRFLTDKVGEGVFASQSAPVAAALEQTIRDEEERAIALDAMAEEIRARMRTSHAEYVDPEGAFAAVRARTGVARRG
jgi:Arc/MetJ-type ribon-helix-helix transcriptional regulator